MKKIPSFMIAGTSSGVGKTTIAMGLMAALSKKMTVQPYKVGPDYIDPAFHSHITGRVCRNLDSYMLDVPMNRYLFEKNLEGAEVAVIEGVMGLFDGAEVGSDIGTSASIAKILDLPVFLVINGAKVAASLAATVKGFDLFDPELRIAGCIINHVNSEVHYQLLKKAIEHHTDVKVCGYLPGNEALTLPERHLGLVPAGEQTDLALVFEKLAENITKTVDVDRILAISTSWSSNGHLPRIGEPSDLSGQVKNESYSPKKFNTISVKIGIAKDKAFNFYYQDALDYLETYGAVEWITFSPLEDKKLPGGLHGLYIGGGFPEIFPEALAANESFMDSLRHALARGVPYIAECGGLMYLCDELTGLDCTPYSMVGWFSGSSVMTKKLQRFGYAELALMKDCIFGESGDSIKVHEFHRSVSVVTAPKVYSLKKVREGKAVKTWQGGYMKGNGIAAYAHMHMMSTPKFGQNFVQACVDYRRNND